MITVEQVSHSYPGRVLPALNNVSLQVEPGEWLALLGHNGSGKSTLARMLNALLIPQHGKITVEGRETSDPLLQPAIRHLVGMIFQNPEHQIVASVVEEDVAWGLSTAGLSRADLRERVEHSLDAVGLLDCARRETHLLSGGEKQRLAIAGVLARRPRYIVSDESTAMLDPLARRNVVELLHRLRDEDGIAIIHVTHRLEEALEADRAIILEQGKLVAEGKPLELFAKAELMHRLGLEQPSLLALVEQLREAGLDLPTEIATVEDLERALCASALKV